MTEQEWLQCDWPQPMLDFWKLQISERKQRLYAVACCRHIWEFLDEPSRAAVEVAEALADGLEGEDRRLDTYIAVAQTNPPSAVLAALGDSAAEAADCTYDFVASQIGATSGEALRLKELAFQAHLFRDIVGNPFKVPSVDPKWRAWHDGSIVSLAREFYANRTFQILPHLADELEQAGCTDALMLAHCRGSTPHVRGCWVIDSLLGRD